MSHYSTSSHYKFPHIKKAKGKYVWDIENNKYLDFTGANNTVILGYKQFKFKSAPNLPGISEHEIYLRKIIMDQFKTTSTMFFKNGSDAVAYSIRLAKHNLKNNSATVCFLGYAGANEYYANTVNKNGVFPVISIQADPNNKNEIDGLECDILVYESRYYKQAKKIKSKIQICDHLKSGANAFIYNNFIPNAINLYGKSVANGYPISIMTHSLDLEKNIFYSSTFGGENTGIEASIQTITELRKRKNIMRLKSLHLYAKNILPYWKQLSCLEIYRLQVRHKILCNGHWQVMLPHTEKDIDKLAVALNNVN